VIDERAINHSFPVLTLNARFADSEDELLSPYIHEQLHWHLRNHNADLQEAMAELRREYPWAPVGAPEGAETAFSTYGHLLDRYLEIQADRALIGADRTAAVIRDKGHYTWIYKTAVQDEAKIAGVARRHRLEITPAISSQDGPALFRKMQDALGGADRLAAVRDFEQQVRAESWDGNTGTALGEVRKRTRWIRSGHLRIDQIGPGSTYVLYFDGTAGWEILPGADKAVDITGGELAFARKYMRDFKLNTWLADRDANYRITSPFANTVRISDGDPAHQLDITLDPVSSLPVKTTSISLADPAHPIPSDEVVMGWETVQRIHFAHRWSVYRSGVRVAEATVERTTVNSGLKAADLAAMPPDMKPVMASR